MNRGKGIILMALILFVLTPVGLAFGQEVKEPVAEYSVEEVIEQYGIRILYEPTLETFTALGTGLAQSATLIAGFLITIFIGWLAGRFASGVLKKIIKKWFEHEKLLKAIGMNKEEFKESSWSQVHNLIPFTVKWFIWLAFFIVAIDLLQIPQATGALTELWAWIPRIVVFIILVSVGFIIARIALKWMSDTKPELFGKEGTVQLAKGLVQGIIFAIIFGIGITTLGVGEDIIPILFWVILAGFMGMAIAIAVGLRHTARYWSAGEAIKRDIEGGEIEIGTHKGIVVKVGITHTKLKEQSKTILLPNESFEANAITITKEPPEKEEKKKVG
jgi:uncharacterized membrane-anchored protein YhcB (DUF1043 family)